jgi:hypothetical protein
MGLKPEGTVEKPNRSAPRLWRGAVFSKKLNSWEIRTFEFQKIAKASFRTPKTLFQQP